MISNERLKQKYERIHGNFNWRDFLGASSLIFGLLLSNSSLNKSNTQATPLPMQPQIEQMEPKENSIKKLKPKRGSKKKPKVAKKRKS